jgi:hypothetical protein
LDSELFEDPKHIHGEMGLFFVFKPCFMFYIFTSLLVENVHAALALAQPGQTGGCEFKFRRKMLIFL